VRVQNAASNMADYGVKPGWQGDAGSHARAGPKQVWGPADCPVCLRGNPGFLMSSKLNLDGAAAPAGLHANLEEVSIGAQAASAILTNGVDSATGRIQSVSWTRWPGLAETPQASISAGLPGVASWLGRKGSRCRPRPLGIEDKVD
jgi:hypothetical protein